MSAFFAQHPEIKDKIFRNISKRASDLLREDLEAMGPVRLSDVENAQQEIVNLIIDAGFAAALNDFGLGDRLGPPSSRSRDLL